MSSQRKIDSARANGSKSHGPVTEDGRKRSSMNALKYGLTACTVVLPNENAGEYTSLLDSYIEDLHPTGRVEMDLVTDMVNAKWRLCRLYGIETDLYEQQMDQQKEKIEADYELYNASLEHSFAFRTLSDSGRLAMLNRLESQLERAYSRALHNLLRLRDARKKDGEKRTESQERTRRANLNPPTPPEWKPPTPSPSLNLTAPRGSDPTTVPGDSLRPLTPTEPL